MAWPTDEELAAAGWVKISRRERRILSAPRVREYYWVDFPHDAYAPEFVGEHPGIVIRAGKLLHATCIIVPVTSKAQAEARYVHKLARNPNPAGHRDGVEAFVICDHLYTVNTCRLRPVFSLKGGHLYPKVEPADFEAICRLVQLALFPPGPKVPPEVPQALEPEKSGENRAKIGKGGRAILGLKGPD